MQTFYGVVFKLGDPNHLGFGFQGGAGVILLNFPDGNQHMLFLQCSDVLDYGTQYVNRVNDQIIMN
jgi:hypothetical protein